MLAGARGGCCGQLSDGRGRVEPASGVSPGGAKDQDDSLVQGPTPGVTAGVGGPGGAAVVGASLAELAEGDGVAAGFSEGMTAEAEHVSVRPEPRIVSDAAELPRGGDHRPVVGRAAQLADVGFAA
jgi:hypothetical protein